jgi:hypothetical protein
MNGPAAALRRDDVKDVPEREVRDAKRQLLVDVQRPRPDAGKRQPDERRGADDDRGRR